MKEHEQQTSRLEKISDFFVGSNFRRLNNYFHSFKTKGRRFAKVLSLAVCILTMHNSQGGVFILNQDGSLTVDGLKIELAHFANNWKLSIQEPNTIKVKSGFPEQKETELVFEGAWDVIGGVFDVKQSISNFNANTIKYTVQLSNDKGIHCNELFVSLKIPLKTMTASGLNINGRQLKLSTDFNSKTWQFVFSKIKNMQIPLKHGILTIESQNGALLQDNRQYSRDYTTARFFLSPHKGMIQKSSLSLNLGYKAYENIPVDISAVSNMGFRDEKAGDQQGGWTDQGSENDLRMMKPGKLSYNGLDFEILDQERNSGRSCIILKGKERPYFPSEVNLATNAQGDFLYILNAIAWPPKGNVEIGTVKIEYADGDNNSYSVRNGIETGNFWGRRRTQDASLAWSGENDNAQLGLYASKFPLNAKKIRQISLKSTGTAVWMIAGITISDKNAQNDAIMSEPVTVKADQHWKPFTDRKISPGSILDFSGNLDAPAGKYGFARNVNGDFEFSARPGKKVRFYGSNLCFHANILKTENIIKVADDFARRGYNIVRFHHYDNLIVDKSDGKSSIKLDAAQIDRLDRMVSEFKKRGIYITLDLYNSRRLLKGEIPSLPNMELNRISDFRALIFINQDVMNNFKQFSANLMNHVNPYTGLAWKDEPALVSIGLVNEDTITENKAILGNSIIKNAYEDAFNKYLTRKSITLNNDRNVWFTRFLAETYNKGFDEMYSFLRGIGVKSMISDQNCGTDLPTAVMRNKGDCVDNHVYWAHPTFPGKAWQLPMRIHATDIISRYMGTVATTLTSRIFGKPFIITEWCIVRPNPYVFGGDILMTAYSAMQGVDGLCHFAYSHAGDKTIAAEGGTVRVFDTIHDPVRRLGQLAGSLLFLRGDVSEAAKKFPFVIEHNYMKKDTFSERPSRQYDRLGLIGKVGMAIETKQLPSDSVAAIVLKPYSRSNAGLSSKNIKLFADGKYLLENMLQQEILSEKNLNMRNQVFSSETGELMLDKKNQCFRMLTPKSEAFIVRKGQRLNGNFMSVSNLEGNCAVMASAMDGNNLYSSSRILLFHFTDTRNTGQAFHNSDMVLVEKWGKQPLLARKGKIEIALNYSDKNYKLFALKLNGERFCELPLNKQNGEISFTADNFIGTELIAAYELVDTAKQ